MKTSIDHLPRRKRQQLQEAVEIIREEVDVEMIILFGSYARGDWVEELAPDGHHYQYQSDFDIYLLSRKRKIANRISRRKQLRDRLHREIQTPIELISESISHFNHCLRQGKYFYVDILKEGILLYNSKQFQLAEPKELSIEQRRKKAEEYFEYWYTRANDFFDGFKNAFEMKRYEYAAFELHQTVERCYSAVLLVFTDYRPKLHDIEKLGKLASAQDPIFVNVFPRSSNEEARRFELLKKAYIDARYNQDYAITKDELSWLAQRVEKLKILTEQSCKKKIASYR